MGSKDNGNCNGNNNQEQKQQQKWLEVLIPGHLQAECQKRKNATAPLVDKNGKPLGGQGKRKHLEK